MTANGLTKCYEAFERLKAGKPFVAAHVGLDCSGLMKPDTHLGENARQIEVSDD